MTLLVPFASYVLAEQVHGSGVLAVLVTAIFLSEGSADVDDVAGRMTGHAFWSIIDTLVTGVAFGSSASNCTTWPAPPANAGANCSRPPDSSSPW